MFALVLEKITLGANPAQKVPKTMLFACLTVRKSTKPIALEIVISVIYTLM
jgi:hypothetical protein